MKSKIINGLNISEITLGTAQLCDDYGISNKLGKPNLVSIKSILECAIKNGITTFDTAPVYGDCEKTLGDFFKTRSEITRTSITKIPKMEFELTHPSFIQVYDKIKNILSNSRNSLQTNIDICLLHNASDMNSYDGFVTDSLIRLKKEGIIKLIGVSTYTPNETKEFLDSNNFDTIQIPFNIFDTRLLNNGMLTELNMSNKIIFARSIFLQGLFFMNEKIIPSKLQMAKKLLHQLQDLSLKYGISISTLAFNFVHGFKEITSSVIGVERVEQLENNINLLNSDPLTEEMKQELLNKFRNIPEFVINPTMWESKK